MRVSRVIVVVVSLLVVVVAGADARADSELAIRIEKHAQRTAGGGVTFWVHVRCGPLPGSPEFAEGHAGAHQPKTGASAEGGLSPDIVCDGVERRYVAGVSVFTESTFRPGPAGASAAVIACNTVGDEQVCVEDGVQRRIVIRGKPPR